MTTSGDSVRIGGYAAAVFEIARGEGALERVESELFQVARAFESSDELRTTLTDHNVPNDRKEGIVHDLLGGRASEVTSTALRMIINAGRIGDLPAIADGFVAASAAARSAPAWRPPRSPRSERRRSSRPWRRACASTRRPGWIFSR